MSRLQLLRLFVVIMAVALPLVGRGAAAQEDSFLKVAQDPAVGSFLTDAEGKTLYLFTPDATPGESTCYDDCAKSWRSHETRSSTPALAASSRTRASAVVEMSTAVTRQPRPAVGPAWNVPPSSVARSRIPTSP